MAKHNKLPKLVRKRAPIEGLPQRRLSIPEHATVLISPEGQLIQFGSCAACGAARFAIVVHFPGIAACIRRTTDTLRSPTGRSAFSAAARCSTASLPRRLASAKPRDASCSPLTASHPGHVGWGPSSPADRRRARVPSTRQSAAVVLCLLPRGLATPPAASRRDLAPGRDAAGNTREARHAEDSGGGATAAA